MSRFEFRAERVPARRVTRPTPLEAPAPTTSVWKVVAEIAGFITVVVLAVGVWVIV